MIFWFFTIPVWVFLFIALVGWEMRGTIATIIGFVFSGLLALIVFCMGTGILNFFDEHFGLSSNTYLFWFIIICIMSLVIFLPI